MGEYGNEFANVDSKLSDIRSTLDKIYFMMLEDRENSRKILHEISDLKNEEQDLKNEKQE